MLDLRLNACADFVRPHAKVCDVGTDHAYLPCYLIKNNITSHVIAADVNEKPLGFAQKHIAEQGYTSAIRTILSDGLKNISSQDADDIIIAGMGGELISRIVLECEWLRNSDKRIILQPMTQTSFLRSFLYEHGFEILKETPILERGHYYTILLCSWNGEKVKVDSLFSIVGKIPLSTHPDRDGYILFQIKRLEKIIEGLHRSANSKNKIRHYQDLVQQLKTVLSNK